MNGSAGLKGAAGGAMAGAALGPVGALAGGAIGGLVGLFGGDDQEAEKYDPNSPNAQAARTFGSNPNHAYDINGSHAQGTQLDQSYSNQGRAQQQHLADVLNNSMMGQGPSAAGMAATNQRQAAIANGASNSAGMRGRSAIGSSIIGNAVTSQGIANAAQNEAIGRQNEMTQARDQYGNVVGNMRGQDIGIAGQNAQLGQANNQYNATNQQNANLANQGMQFGAAQNEMQARLHQGDMEFTNLNPGQQDQTGNALLAAGANLGGQYLANKYAPAHAPAAAHGAVINGGHWADGIPQMANGGLAVPGGGYQNPGTLSIGQRRTPVVQHSLGEGLADALTQLMAAYHTQKGENKDKTAQDKKDAEDKQARDAKTASDELFRNNQLAAMYPQVTATPGTPAGAQPVVPYEIPPTYTGATNPHMAKGGVINGPQKTLVGEAGPEAIIDIKGLVNRPTLMNLGSQGKAQAVLPLGQGHDHDRNRVLADIMNLLGGRR